MSIPRTNSHESSVIFKEVLMGRLCLLLAVAGFVLPYYFFISFLADTGPDIKLIVEQLFANDFSSFFAVDLLITASPCLA